MVSHWLSRDQPFHEQTPGYTRYGLTETMIYFCGEKRAGVEM